jgi:predicted dehydrogenase
MIGIGVIGYGYWGPNLVRNFMDSGRFVVRGISDLSPKNRATAQARCPGAKVTDNAQELIDDPQIDAIAIATPVSTHYALASAAIKAGKHVFVEKPMTSSTDDAKRLVDEAAAKKKVLLVDHTFVYGGPVRKIKELVTEGQLGDILYYDSVRVNLGLFQHDVNVIWDLAVHDVSILHYLIPQRVRAVSAMGARHVKGQPENIAYVTMVYDESLMAHLHLNWLAPVKVRQTLIGGSKRMIVYDDLETSEKIKIYDKGVDLETSAEGVQALRVGYRSGDMYSPKIEMTEALRVEALHFADCIEHGKKPITDGEAGLRVVEVVEAASQSMAQRGRLIELKEGEK